MVQRREQMVQRREQMVQRGEQMVQRREQMVQRKVYFGATVPILQPVPSPLQPLTLHPINPSCRMLAMILTGQERVNHNVNLIVTSPPTL